MICKLVNKIDAIIGLIIGFLIGFFFLISARVLETDLELNWEKKWDWVLLITFPILCCLGVIIASVLKKKFLIIYQIAKFGLVGALNTFIDLGIFNVLILLTSIATGVNVSLFKGISFLFAATNSYFWNKHWTFEKKDKVFASGEFAKFMAVTFVGFLLNVGTFSLVVNVIGSQYGIGDKLWANIGLITATFVGFAWNFIGSKFIVFKK